jgi:OmpA-OmpF porin, OOP family
MRFAKIFSILLITIIFSSCATDNRRTAAENTGYWDSTPGKIWKTGFGGCWRNSSWTPDQAVNCGGAAPAPAPAPSNTIYWNDEDGDGVLDADDACPRTPLGVPVNSSGCANDNDGDGVPDYLDKCPETPLGNVVDTNGCSLALVKLQGIHFRFDSASLTSEAKSILDRSLSAIRANSSQNIQVEGHTDSTGSDSYNLDLSQRRAETVVNYLSSKGVNSSRLSARGFGESSPVSSNDTAASRAQNRRVEVFAR